jgi:hypothetical protein
MPWGLLNRELISGYNAKMIKRSAEEFTLSVKSTYMVHDSAKLMVSPVMTVGVTNTS